MARYLMVRLISAVPILFLITALAFILTTEARGDPALLALQQSGQTPTPELLEKYRRILGLEDPLPVRYVHWLVGLAHGDLGNSFLTNRPVAEMLGERIVPTLELGLSALVVSMVAGVTLGVALALSQDGLPGLITRGLAYLIAAAPPFWLAIGLILLFGTQWRLLPVAGYGSWQQFLLPTLSLAAGPTAATLRVTRNSVLDVLGEDYVRTARAKGLPQMTVVLRHIMRSASLPVLALSGVRFGHLLAGSVIIESIFAWPGMGSVLVAAISGRDLPVIGGYVLLTGVPVVIANILADLASCALDPRVRLGIRAGGSAR